MTTPAPAYEPMSLMRLADLLAGAEGSLRWRLLAEHLAARDGRGAPEWVGFEPLKRLWFPFNTPAARADAIVHAPAAFRSRGVYLSAHELDVASQIPGRCAAIRRPEPRERRRVVQ